MRKTFVLLLLIPAFLTGCKKSPAPGGSAGTPTSSSAPADVVSKKLQELAGSGASDCGRFKSQAMDQMKVASDCAMKAAQGKQPFYVAYDMPGLTIGIAGNSEGKLFAVQAQQSQQPGAAAEIQTAPCPAELRIAQSGRLTCAPAGAMGMQMGGSNPHGGGMMPMPPAMGQSPHGGMSTPPPGTPNPHGTTKTPPKK